MKLREKYAVITEAGRGIGAAMATRFVREYPGAVVIVGNDEVGVRDLCPLGVRGDLLTEDRKTVR